MLFSLPKYICNSLGWLVKSWSQTTIELNYSFTYSFRIGTIFPIFLCFECWKAMCVQTGNYPLPCECATTLNKDLFTASLVSQNGQSGSINASHTSNNTRDFFHSQIPMSLGISSIPITNPSPKTSFSWTNSAICLSSRDFFLVSSNISLKRTLNL